MKTQSQYRITAQLYHSKLRLWGWRDANQLRALAGVPEDPVQFPAPHGSSLLSVTPVKGALVPTLAWVGIASMWRTFILAGKTLVHKSKMLKIFFSRHGFSV